jgi:FkbM family methyltransferase
MKNIFIDCGSNIGWAVKFYTKLYSFENWDYVCIEPNPHCVNVLKENFGTHPNVKILPMAVSSIKKTCNFIFSSRLSEGGTINPYKIEENVEAVSVETITIDELLKLSSEYDKKFIKIDIEGEEFDLMEQMIREEKYKYFSKIVCEFHSDYMKEINFYPRQYEIVDFFQKNNYLVKQISKNQYLFEDATMPSIQATIQAH